MGEPLKLELHNPNCGDLKLRKPRGLAVLDVHCEDEYGNATAYLLSRDHAIEVVKFIIRCYGIKQKELE